MFLEAKQSKLQQLSHYQQQHLPNGNATFIDSGCNASSNNSNKIPPRPPIRSTTTTTTVSIDGTGQQRSISMQHEDLSPATICSQLNSIATNNLSSTESPNVKFLLSQSNTLHKQQQQQHHHDQNQQHQHQKQAIPQAAMNEMRV